jgi:hypothetical protein
MVVWRMACATIEEPEPMINSVILWVKEETVTDGVGFIKYLR